ncbi:MAG: hypothetical protein ACFNUU_05450 [Campylobacter sp.]|uniref:hypothetical protein n=1 Tax=Campylobacter sp. TaxID=205 RepID=UPI0036246266
MIKLDNKKSENVAANNASTQKVGATAKKDEFNIYGFSEAIIKELTEENIPSIPKNYTVFLKRCSKSSLMILRKRSARS